MSSILNELAIKNHEYVLRYSSGDFFIIRLKILLKLDMLLKPEEKQISDTYLSEFTSNRPA